MWVAHVVRNVNACSTVMQLSRWLVGVGKSWAKKRRSKQFGKLSTKLAWTETMALARTRRLGQWNEHSTAAHILSWSRWIPIPIFPPMSEDISVLIGPAVMLMGALPYCICPHARVELLELACSEIVKHGWFPAEGTGIFHPARGGKLVLSLPHGRTRAHPLVEGFPTRPSPMQRAIGHVVMLIGAHGEVDIGALALDDIFQTTHASSLLVFWPDQVVKRPRFCERSSCPKLPPGWLPGPRTIEDFSWV